MNHVHAGHVTRSGRALAGLLAAAFVTAGLVLAVLVPRGAPAAGAEATTVTAADGPALYLQNCASCHGPQGEGAAAGPTLLGVGAASVDFYLRTGRMPLGAPEQRPQRQDPAFTEEQILALIDYVVSLGPDAGPPIPQVRGDGDVGRGWELYTANCAACHAATGSGNAVGGGNVAYGLGQATDVQVAEAMLIGPGAMPRFQLDDEEREAIIAYVNYLQDASTPGGAPIGGFGPVAEGFVAVFVGLTAIVAVARFVGRKSHEGEPDSPLPTDALTETASDEGAVAAASPRTRT